MLVPKAGWREHDLSCLADLVLVVCRCQGGGQPGSRQSLERLSLYLYAITITLHTANSAINGPPPVGLPLRQKAKGGGGGAGGAGGC